MSDTVARAAMQIIAGLVLWGFLLPFLARQLDKLWPDSKFKRFLFKKR